MHFAASQLQELEIHPTGVGRCLKSTVVESLSLHPQSDLPFCHICTYRSLFLSLFPPPPCYCPHRFRSLKKNTTQQIHFFLAFEPAKL